MLAQAGDKNHGEECCGNGLCDGLETSASCPADCVGDVETLTQTVYGSAVNAWLRSCLSVLPASCCHLSSIVSSASVSTVVHPSLVHLSLVHLSLVHLSLVDLICPAICPCMQSPYLQVTVALDTAWQSTPGRPSGVWKGAGSSGLASPCAVA